MSDVEQDVKDAMDTAYRAERKIDSHEDICALRYKGIQVGMENIVKDLGVLSTRMWVAAGSVIGTLVVVIIFLAARVQ